MKLKDVQVGGRYLAKVSGQIAIVRVTELKEVPASRGRWKTIIYAVNEATGRRITVRSPQRLRRRVETGCEFCNLPANRPAGRFACPYCRKVWTGVEG